MLEDLRLGSPAIGLNESDLDAIRAKLQRLEQDPRAYTSQRELIDDLLAVINGARQHKYAARPRAAQPWRNLEELPTFNDRLLAYSEQVLALHQRRATLRQSYRADLSVREDYDVWVSLVQETMLGGLDEQQRRDEFALQAAYVVFIRNRHNFNNIIKKKDARIDLHLKYILGLFNSSILNYWFSRHYNNVHINPSYFRQLPIYPADEATQAAIVGLVDQLLEVHRRLNLWREQGYRITTRRNGTQDVGIPHDELLSELQAARPELTVDTLFGALARGQIEIPPGSDSSAPISGNVFIPARYPEHVVLRHKRFWLRVPDERLRRFLVGSLGRPRWRGQLWKDVQTSALYPADPAALDSFFQREQERISDIAALLSQAEQLDNAIDDRVLDLYGITDPAERLRVRGSAPLDEDEAPADEQPEPPEE